LLESLFCIGMSDSWPDTDWSKVALSGLRCDYIVQLLGWGVKDTAETAYLVYELAPIKFTLFDWRTQRSELMRNTSQLLPTLADLHLFADLARALDFMHTTAQMVHRDITINNFLLFPALENGARGKVLQAKLIDFGQTKVPIFSSQLASDWWLIAELGNFG